MGTAPQKTKPAAELTEMEKWEAEYRIVNDACGELARSATQRQWLIITRALDRTRDQIGDDAGLTLLACAYLKGVRDHGGASIDRLLDMSDQELRDLLGFPTPTESTE